MKEYCAFKHKSVMICKSHSKGSRCENKQCGQRHPKFCRHYIRDNCWWGESCSYLHNRNEDDEKQIDSKTVELYEDEIVDIGIDIEVERIDSNSDKTVKENENEIVGMDMDDNSSTNSCDICRSDKAKNEC